MKTITMVQFRKDAEGILRRVAQGERFLLSHRGKPAARLEPITTDPAGRLEDDPLFRIAERATPSPKGPTDHRDIDRIVYARP
jgi:prevent-host-death family protein